MGVFARIFGTPATVEKAVDGVVNGVDAMFFTDEEKSRANLQLLEAKIEFYRATQGSRLARRVLAFMVVGTWLSMILFGLTMNAIGFTELSDHAYNVATETLGTPVAIIIGFYFATSMISTAKGK